MYFLRRFLVAVCVMAMGLSAHADEVNWSEQQLAFFESKIRPVLVEHCYSCHAQDSKILRGGLLVDSRNGLLDGGDSGTTIVPGKPEESLLIEALKYESYEMPPEGKLPDNVIADFEKWIRDGAADPRVGEAKASHKAIDLQAGRQFWSFQPIKKREPSNVANNDHVIDQFVLERLAETGLEPAPQAKPLVLLRRLHFDLIGLPPSEKEIENFEASLKTTPLEMVLAQTVDELLKRTAFGERWGRHWLDVARYADSTGGGRSLLFGESWRYRDYVIESFNEDKPFDQFVMEQLAGDLMSSDSVDQAREQLIATAFLAIGPHNYENQDKEQLRMDIVDEQIDVMGKVFLGMTLGCARCHDHKFDPIPHADYYALAGIFRSTDSLEPGNVGSWVKTPLPLPPEEEDDRQQALTKIDQLTKSVKELETEITKLQSDENAIEVDDAEAKLTGTWTPSTSIKGFTKEGYQHSSTLGDRAEYEVKVEPGMYRVEIAYTASSNRATNARVDVQHAEGGSTKHVDQHTPPDGGRTASVGEYQFEDVVRVAVIVEETRPTIIDGIRIIPLDPQKQEDQQRREKIQSLEMQLASTKEDLADWQKRKPADPPAVMSVRDEEEEVGDYHICIRGDAHNLGDKVPRGFLSVATYETPQIPVEFSGRQELAQWIASPENPLTARVFANRVWQKLFGAGLVRSVDNFGIPGDRPSHPELLDRLAYDFMQDGWSIKRLIRRIVLSNTYQQSVQKTEQANAIDPDNRLLSHQNKRRLDAESIHDAMLFVSGELNRNGGGDTIRSGTRSEYGYKFDVGRRAVYYPIFRNRLPEILTAFDFPDPNLSTGKRTVSTLSTQSLFLMNSPFAMDRAEQTALRIHDLQPEERLQWLGLSILGRDLLPEEEDLFYSFVNQQQTDQAWERVIQALFGSVAFRYLD